MLQPGICRSVIGVAASALFAAALALAPFAANAGPPSHLGRVVSTVSANSHACAVMADTAGVKCWGFNGYGQVGDATTTNRSEPVDVTGLGSGVVSVTVGESHSCALTMAGAVKCWGLGTSGQLGNGSLVNSATPVDVTGLGSGVTSVAAGAYHTCAITSAEGLKCWGYNGFGELGVGSLTSSPVPLDVVGLSSGIAAVTGGYGTTCALTTAGGVKCWGYNLYGAAGTGVPGSSVGYYMTAQNVVGLSSGVVALAKTIDTHNCALTSGGAVKCWGRNTFGQLGIGSQNENEWPTPQDVVGLSSGVAAITAGNQHTCALTAGGALKCWGLNGNGQVGDGTTTNRTTPTDVVGMSVGVLRMDGGQSSTCALLAEGGLRCWGRNSFGMLGDGTMVDRSTPTDVAGLSSGVAAVHAGNYNTCALKPDGGVSCWGLNNYGQVGDGTTIERASPVGVSGLSTGAAAVSVGSSHACARMSNGGVKCWGSNAQGQLGDGTTMDRPVPIEVTGLAGGVIAIAAGADHTCALTTLGGVKCWGGNASGQLGIGTTAGSLVPVDVTALPSAISAITAGDLHTCALTSGGGMKCWGDNGYGGLGDGTTIDRNLPVDVSGLTSGVASITGGYRRTCALTTAGGAKCWGWNTYGAAGTGQGPGSVAYYTTPQDVVGLSSGVTALQAGETHTCALTAGGAMMCWGRNSRGNLGNGGIDEFSHAGPDYVTGLSSGVASIAAGGNHTCARMADGLLKCWGRNEQSQVGNGTTLFGYPTPQDIRRAQSLAFTPPASLAFGTPANLVATAGSGLAVTFDTWTPGACSITGNSLSATSAGGTCGIRASQPGDVNAPPAPRAALRIRTTKGAQAILFDPLPDRAFDAPPFTVSATATSGLAVIISSLTPGVCTSSGTNGINVTHAGAAGTCTIAANQPGDANWGIAPQVTRSFSVIQPRFTVAKAGAGAGTVTSLPAGVSCGSVCMLDFTSLGAGASIVLTATPASGSVLSGWSGCNFVDGTDRCHITFTASAQVVTVTFGTSSPGMRDATFGANGLSDPAFPGFTSGGWVAVARQADGKLVAGGYLESAGNADFAVARYLTDGSLDPTFGSGGFVTTSIGASRDEIQSILVQPDGKILAVGRAFNGSYDDQALVRYNPNGTLDNTFGCATPGTCAGFIATALGSYPYTGSPFVLPFGLALQADGRIVVASDRRVGTYDQGVITRYNANGTLDGSFGVGGQVVLAYTYHRSMWAAAVQSDGKIVVAGATFISPGGRYDATVIRLDSNGGYDTTFNGNGSINIPAGIDDYFTSLAIQPDGKIVAGGMSDVGGGHQPLLARFNADGTPDITFGSGGRVLESGVSVNGYYNGLALMPDGKIMLGGHFAPSQFGTEFDLWIARYNSNGTRDAGFGLGGVITPLVNAEDEKLNRLLVEPNGRIVAVGRLSSPSRPFVMRILSRTPQAITWPALSGRVLGDPPFTLLASSDSLLPVAYQSQTLAVCTVSGNTATIVAAGTCSIVASQGGDGTFEPAVNVVRTFNVALATPSPIVTAVPSPSNPGQSVTLTVVVGGNAGTATGTATFLDGGANITGCVSIPLTAGSAQCPTSALAIGVHSITASYSGSAAYVPATSPAISHVVRSSVTVTRAGTGTGRVVSSPAGIDCGSDCSELSATVFTITLTATADGHSFFSGWSGGTCSGAGACSVTMDAARTVIATFTRVAESPRIATGAGHTLAIRGDGTLWAWGDNFFSQVGDGSVTDRLTPVQVGAGSNWIEVAAGDNHSLALRADGTLWAWGRNDFGQIGDGSTTQRAAPVQIGAATNWTLISAGGNHSLALRSDGTLWAWGANFFGQLGDGTTSQRNAPVQIGSASTWQSVSAGGNHAVATRSDGTLWTWGRNDYGQLGDNTTTQRSAPAQIGSAIDWAMVAAGELHTLAIRVNGTLWGWGYNAFGQLGDGTSVDRHTPTQVGAATNWLAVAPGAFHTVATRADGTLWAWGQNDYGQLGAGNFANVLAPQRIGSATDWSVVAAGGGHSVALRNDAELWAWGRNLDGQLGDGTTTARTTPQAIAYPDTNADPAFPDFNLDGKPDLIWSNTVNGNTYVWYMNGPVLIADAFIAGIDPSWKVQGVADFNGDGKPDIVWRNTANGNTYVWYMNGPTLMTDAFVFSLPPEWVIQGVADFNADGKPDFLMRNVNSGNAFAWFFDNANAIGDQFLFNVDPSWKVEGVGDLNADGQPDLFFRNMAGGLAFAWFTQYSAGTLSLAGSTPPLFSIDPVWEIVQVADWNADASPDFVFRNRDSGVVFVWYVNGTALSANSDFIIQIDPSWEIVPRR